MFRLNLENSKTLLGSTWINKLTGKIRIITRVYHVDGDTEMYSFGISTTAYTKEQLLDRFYRALFIDISDLWFDLQD